MVLAATARVLKRGDCALCSSEFKFLSYNPLYEPTNLEQRQAERRKEWNVWMSSTADDLDLLGDWWFWWSTFNGERGGFSDTLTLALFVFSVLGSVTWLLEFYQVAFARPDQSWKWLQLMILIVEDLPQMVITSLIVGRFSNLTSVSLFNLMTSFYSLMIRMAGELFLNWCYCCEKIHPDFAADLENAKSYKKARN